MYSRKAGNLLKLSVDLPAQIKLDLLQIEELNNLNLPLIFAGNLKQMML
jgi:hypothetical protein